MSDKYNLEIAKRGIREVKKIMDKTPTKEEEFDKYKGAFEESERIIDELRLKLEETKQQTLKDVLKIIEDRIKVVNKKWNGDSKRMYELVELKVQIEKMGEKND